MANKTISVMTGHMKITAFMKNNNFKVESIIVIPNKFYLFSKIKEKLPFACDAIPADWEAIGKIGRSIDTVASLFNAWDTAIRRNKSIFTLKLLIRTYIQLIHDKQNEDIVKKTYELQQQKVPKVFDNVD